MNKQATSFVLPVIVFAQFAGTSLWFAGNAVVPDMVFELNLPENIIGYITMAVQAGFIAGTLIFAATSLADRISPVKVYLLSSLAGALANFLLIYTVSPAGIMITRFITGFFLAGIYPVGMKIASDWHKEGLGKALGYLVGALVIGTAFPHLVRYAGTDLPWNWVITFTSVTAVAGGLILYLFVGDGPYRGNKAPFRPGIIFDLFRNKAFRRSAFGYFGHMWELYAYWAFVPVLISITPVISELDENHSSLVSLLSFFVIASGGISCAIGGHLSSRIGSKRVAFYSLILSATCSLIIPFAFNISGLFFLAIIVLWGFFVIPDSPQFSTLVAQSSDPSFVATGLTIVNSLGFAITLVSIQLLNWLWFSTESLFVFWVLLVGPVLGLIYFRRF